jgi:WD40 repeat protein
VVVAITGKTMSLPAAVTEETRAIRPCHKFEGHTEAVADVIHVPGGHRIMTGSRDGSLRVWDLQSRKQIGNDWQDGGIAVDVIRFSPDGKKVASGSVDGAVRCTSFAPDGKLLATGCSDSNAYMWDVSAIVKEAGLGELLLNPNVS